MGTVGFIDDYLRVMLHYRKGLLGRYKLAGQILLGLGVFVAVYFYPAHGILDPRRNEHSVPQANRHRLSAGSIYRSSRSSSPARRTRSTWPTAWTASRPA